MKTNWIQRLLARLGTPAGASVSVDIAALKTALDALGLQYVEGSVSDGAPAAADFDTDLTEATDNHYNGMLLMFTDGNCAGQAHVINDYDGTAKNVSFSAEDIWTEAPGNGNNFIILPSTGSMAKAIYTRLGAPAGASIAADLVTIAAYLDTEIAAIITSQGRMLFTMDFWSDTQEELLINATAGDKTLPDVAVAELPGGATIVRAIAMFKFRMVENVFDGANAINVAQHIQVRDSTPGTWRDAISIADNLFNFAAKAREGGDILIGDHDIAVEVDEIATYNFQWHDAAADQISLNFNDIQCGLRIWYSV